RRYFPRVRFRALVGVSAGLGSAFLRGVRGPRITCDREGERAPGARGLPPARPRPRRPARPRPCSGRLCSPCSALPPPGPERATGARVLATVRPRPRHPDRRRRFADHDASPYFDPAADGYQLTYLHVARAGASRLVLTIAGEETSIAAVVAANVAAIAADEA